MIIIRPMRKDVRRTKHSYDETKRKWETSARHLPKTRISLLSNRCVIYTVKRSHADMYAHYMQISIHR